MVLKIAYSEGHGLHTAGKRTPTGEREWTFNHWMGSGFAEEMAKYEGVALKLVSDPTGQRDTPLQERSDLSNDWGADLYLAFHHNAYLGSWGTHTGTETFTYDGAWGGKKANDPEEIALAREAQNAIVAVYKLRDRGLKKENFHEVRVPRAKAILLEGGYMDSSIDIKVMRDSNKVKEAGRQIARNVARKYGLKLRQVAGAIVSAGSFYRVQVGAFSTTANAAAFAATVEKKTGLGTYIVESGKYIRVQVGAFTVKKNAENRLKDLQGEGYKDAFITRDGTNAVPETEPYNEPPKPVLKSIEQLAKEVIDGKHGTGDARKASLGAQYAAVQARVNELSQPKATKEYIHLPQNNKTWGVYALDEAPVSKNLKRWLTPAVFDGGITYEVLGWSQANVAIIQTESFGRVKIYVGPDTNARIYKK